MFGLSCLSRPSASPETLLLSEGFHFTLVAILLMALIGSALASPLVRRGYRRRVVRLMRFDQVAPRPSQWWSSKADAEESSTYIAKVTPGSGSDASDLSDLVMRRERRITVATTLAWSAFVMSAVPVASWVLADSPVSDRGYFVVVAGLLALGPHFINLPRRFARRALVVGLIACALAALLIDSLSVPVTAVATPSSGTDDLGGGEWAIAVGAALAYVSIFHRRLRGLVLPVFVVAAVALMLIVIPLGYIEPYLGSCLGEMSEPGQGEQSAPFVLAVGMLMALAVWLGFKALDGLAKLVEAGWLSELSLISVVSLALIAMILIAGSLTEQTTSPSRWLAWLWLPWLVAAAATYALTLRRHLPANASPRLLVLRVFAHHRKQLKLLDELQSRWRYVGPVHQIGGPDLAITNVDPNECALYLVGRLHDYFLPAAATPVQLAKRLHTRADHEGRYGIGEVFCFNSAWQGTVEQLMQISDAILLDLRGLTAQRKGTSYELRVLARTGLLDRVVAIGDKDTDWTLVDTLLIDEGQEPRRLAQRIVGTELRTDVIFNQLLGVASNKGNARSRAD